MFLKFKYVIHKIIPTKVPYVLKHIINIFRYWSAGQTTGCPPAVRTSPPAHSPEARPRTASLCTWAESATRAASPPAKCSSRTESATSHSQARSSASQTTKSLCLERKPNYLRNRLLRMLWRKLLLCSLCPILC